MLAFLFLATMPVGATEWDTLGGATLQHGVAVQLQLQSGFPDALSGGPAIGGAAVDARLFLALSQRVDLGVGLRAAGIPSIGAGPVLEVRVNFFRIAHFALAADITALSAFVFGDSDALTFNLSAEAAVMGSSFIGEHWQATYGVTSVTHVLIDDVAAQGFAARAGFAYRFNDRGQQIFYHMYLGPPIFPLSHSLADNWHYLPLIRVALGVAL